MNPTCGPLPCDTTTLPALLDHVGDVAARCVADGLVLVRDRVMLAVQDQRIAAEGDHGHPLIRASRPPASADLAPASASIASVKQSSGAGDPGADLADARPRGARCRC